GCDDFVIKPFREEVIFEKMAQHLGVCYVCEELTLSSQEDKERTTSLSPHCLTPSDLAVMSAEWITELHQAARNLDSDLMNRLIEQIPQVHTPLAQALANLINDFRFDRIMALTQP
ncbi:MAG TPA: hybrid sensor histidine kinase/response regulator, partial [Cyanobacteria bacterium UBA12227]|nr:hybrid sensor histidine kinase/response regulator [Cyanobacteria bacterium UBA12227]